MLDLKSIVPNLAKVAKDPIKIKAFKAANEAMAELCTAGFIGNTCVRQKFLTASMVQSLSKTCFTILLPMFTPFTFGPVIGSCSPCCGCCRTASECDCKLAKSPMELSFTFSDINVIISALGVIAFLFTTINWTYGFKASEGDKTIAIIFGISVIQLVFIGIFHLFEKKCLCCCNFCFPFTKRETFDIGDAPTWQDAMTDLSHVYQDAPDPRVEVEAVELENLGNGGLILKVFIFNLVPKSQLKKFIVKHYVPQLFQSFKFVAFSNMKTNFVWVSPKV